MTKEERELRREQREHMKRMEAAAKEAGRGPIDVPFLLLVLLLTGVGLIMLLSASFPSAYYESGDPLYYFKRQAAFATLGLAAMVVIGRINYARFRGVAKIALGISIALLVAVIIPGVGITSHGATRWLGIPGTTMRFQPSEIAKLGVILYFADSISKKKDKMRTLRYGILPYGFILALIAVLMYFEPHLSGTVLILGIGAAMMFVGGIRGYWVGIGIGGVAAVAYAFLSGLITYNSSRIAIWLDPLNDAFKTGTGYQTRQSLIAIGSMMGSGGLIVMDETTCMVDIAKFFLEFTVDELCGKCTPCRIGTKRLLEMLTKITEGKATMEDLDKMEQLCYYIKKNALCGLGQTAPNPVLSTLRYFRDEYIAHIVDKKCPAGVCKKLLKYSIDKDKCIGCGMCARNCPADAITKTASM